MRHSRRDPKAGAIILAGGRARRLGRGNKAFVPLGGRPLIEHVLEVAASITNDIIVVSNEPSTYHRYAVRSIADAVPGAGPLGGIYSGLLHSPRDLNLVLGCDMPFVRRALLVGMIGEIRERDALIPRIDLLIEPLCALYRKRCAPTLERALRAHRYKIGRALGEMNTGYADEEFVRAVDPDLDSFVNINTPDDLQRAEEVYIRDSKNRLPSHPPVS